MCGLISILMSAQNSLLLAGVLITASSLLDLFDGFSARKLNANSEFGLQLDSLVDMVSLGIAPIVLIYQYLSVRGDESVWLWMSITMVAMAGAIRLARFNLLPAKTGREDVQGLTISHSGATIAMAVLADLSSTTINIPTPIYIIVMVIFSFLMVSTISFLPFSGFVRTKRRTAFSLSYISFALFLLPIFGVWLSVNMGYIGISLSRATYHRVVAQN
jgi:CDP-diacylglycerol--serine O-phosphatidyltransferase